MTAVTVQVTADDIAHGGSTGSTCPVHRAMCRALPQIPELWVGGMEVGTGDLAGDQLCALPDAAADWISCYDTGNPVEPFSFEIDLPGELLAAVPGA